MKNITKNITTQQWDNLSCRICRGLLATLAMIVLLAFSSCAPADTDGDGITDDIDNCPNVPNPDQLNSDGANDGGDACDDDDDNDSKPDDSDNCRTVANSDQKNSDDTDEVGDECDDDDNDSKPDDSDNCRTVANSDQKNSDDTDEVGDECDDNDDNDSEPDISDVDDDNDGLIEIGDNRIEGVSAATMLDNIRNNPAGTSYNDGSNPESDAGCPEPNGCIGYEIEDHIDLSGMNWTPIGLTGEGTTDSPYVYAAFTTTLEGNNHMILNLTIENASDNVGFFAILGDGSSVRKLRFEGGRVTSTSTTSGSKGSVDIGTVSRSLTSQPDGSPIHTRQIDVILYLIAYATVWFWTASIALWIASIIVRGARRVITDIIKHRCSRDTLYSVISNLYQSIVIIVYITNIRFRIIVIVVITLIAHLICII